MLQVRLQPGLRGGQWARLRPLRGSDELAVGDRSGLAATALIDRLLVAAPGTSVAPGRAGELAICDRDRLLAEIYRQYYGDRVEAWVECRGCGESFELGFSLRELMASLHRPPTGVSGPDEDGTFELADGRRFRLPTTADLLSIADLDTDSAAAALAERCLVDGEAGANRDVMEEAMAAVGPVLDVELSAACPDCQRSQPVRFDIQSHLLAALEHERRWLSPEIHRIASCYGWSLAEILELPREDRRALVRLIQSEPASGRPPRAGA